MHGGQWLRRGRGASKTAQSLRSERQREPNPNAEPNEAEVKEELDAERNEEDGARRGGRPEVGPREANSVAAP